MEKNKSRTIKNFPVIYGPKGASIQVFQINIRKPLEVNALLKHIDRWKDDLATQLHFLLETTEAETNKILEGVDEDHPTHSSEELAKLSRANWNNGFAAAIRQILGE
jgi:hypothetical protein